MKPDSVQGRPGVRVQPHDPGEKVPTDNRIKLTQKRVDQMLARLRAERAKRHGDT